MGYSDTLRKGPLEENILWTLSECKSIETFHQVILANSMCSENLENSFTVDVKESALGMVPAASDEVLETYDGPKGDIFSTLA